MIRIIHTGDNHLGVQPDQGKAWSTLRKEEIRDSFRQLILKVQEEKADLLLISGDLFHRPPTMRDLREVNYLFATIPNTRVALMAGNHDYIRPGSAWTEFHWNSNVIGFWEEQCQKKTVPELDLALYGCSYHRQQVRENLYADVRREGTEQYHILLAHGGDETHSPFDARELADRFTYTAAAHIHKPQIPVENKLAFCGSPEPIDRNETGAHGYMRVLLDAGQVHAEFVPFAGRSYMNIRVTVTPRVTQAELEDSLKKGLAQKGLMNLFRIYLRGERGRDLRFDTDRLYGLGNVTEVIDETVAAYDFDELLERCEGTLVGAYIRRFRASKDPVEQRALRMGLEALLQEKE